MVYMANILSIYRGAISVINLEETIQWYCDNLGLEVEFRYDFPSERKTKAAFIKLGDARIKLFEAEVPNLCRPAVDTLAKIYMNTA
jgi:catechol 2,3-dioxygenase-like lactoylglutathione lyase family enzyme